MHIMTQNNVAFYVPSVLKKMLQISESSTEFCPSFLIILKNQLSVG